MSALRTSYKIWLYKSKTNKQGENPIYFRIIVGDKKAEIATGIFVASKNFDVKTGRINRKVPEADFLNLKIETLVDSFKKHYKESFIREEVISADTLKQRMLGNDKRMKGIIEYFAAYNKKQEKLIGVDYCFKTVERYGITLRYLKEFIKKQYNVCEFLLVNLDNKFISNFDLFLKSEKKNNPNTAAKSLSNLKAVVNNSIVEGYLTHNPFHGYKIKLAPTNIQFLTEQELKAIERKTFIERLEFVKRIFLFQCYTGLAFSDMVKLKKSELIKYNGKLWINTTRTKTKIPVKLPIIKQADKILKTLNSEGELVFKSLSNQKMNSYLKEIADICNINKKLSTHVARHTFATTVTLAAGISIDVVSAMLGHNSLKTTQIYAKVVPSKIEAEMKKLW